MTIYEIKKILTTKYKQIKRTRIPAWPLYVAVAILVVLLFWYSNENRARNAATQEQINKVREDFHQQLNNIKAAKDAKKYQPLTETIVAVHAPTRPQPSQQPQPVSRPIGDVKSVVHNIMLQYWGEDQWPYLDDLISRESGWKVSVVNAHSGAGGLFQALPFSKTGCNLADAVCQAHWGCNYVRNKYGSPYNAIQFWNVHHYY